jgi:threonine synthase
VTDDAIRARIRAGFEEFGQVWCPHTATAAEVYERVSAARQGAPKKQGRWVVVATAHPAKFREIVEPLIGQAIPVPETLAKLFARPTECTEIDADLSALRAALGRRNPSWKS